MGKTYSLCEVQRICGLEAGRLRYLERLRLVRPRSRWGQRFYSFADLVALENIRRLAARRVPARRLGRAMVALERRMGVPHLSFETLRILPMGRTIAVVPAGAGCSPIEPISGQFLFPFDAFQRRASICQIISRDAQLWFDRAIAYDTRPECSRQAVCAWRRVIALAAQWPEAQIRLALALWRTGELAESEQALRIALRQAPSNATAHFHLGCLLADLEDFQDAATHLRQAIRLQPGHGDARFHLALVLERMERPDLARVHWRFCLRREKSGAWADYARSRLAAGRAPRRQRCGVAAPIPFRAKRA